MAGSSRRSSWSEPKPPCPRSKKRAEPGAGELEVRDRLEVAGEHGQAHAVALGQGLEHLGHAGRDVSAEVVLGHPRVGLHRRRAEVVAAVVEALRRRRRPAGRAAGRSRGRCAPPPRSAPPAPVPPRRRRARTASTTACACARGGLQQQRAVDVEEQEHARILPGALAAPSLRALGSRARQRPALLQVPEAPDRERHRPGRDEQADDDVADGVEVDARHPVPEAAVEAELLGRDREQLDRADDAAPRPPRAP